MQKAPSDRAIELELVDALDGFFLVTRRSGVLEGSMAQRATYCVPFVEGTSAGLHLSAAERFVIRSDDADVWPQFTDETHERVSAAHRRAYPQLLARGLLRPGSAWSERLAEGWFWTEGRRVCIWTGLLARVPGDGWLRLCGAYARRARIPITERILVGSDTFVPLVLEVDLTLSPEGAELWVDEGIEAACVQPLLPAATWTEARLEEVPEVGARFNAFYDSSFMEEHARKDATGRYRKLIRDELLDPGPSLGDFRYVYAGPKVHRVERYRQFLSDQGSVSDAPPGQALGFVEMTVPWGARGVFDGDVLRDMDLEIDPELPRAFLETWKRLYGELNPFADEMATRFLHHTRPGEPFLLGLLWAFAITPPGWSTLIEVSHFPRLDGMRGVISTDRFHSLSAAFRMREGEFEIPQGATLGRAIPVPRTHLHPTFRLRSLEA